MQKLTISLLFFTLCFTAVSYAQRSRTTSLDNGPAISGTFQGHSLLHRGDTIFGFGKLFPKQFEPRDSLLQYLKPGESTRHYFSKDGKEYYMDIVPAPKAKRVDSSNVW